MLYFYPEIKAAIIIQEEIVMPEGIFLPVIVILFIRAAISPDKANNTLTTQSPFAIISRRRTAMLF